MKLLIMIKIVKKPWKKQISKLLYRLSSSTTGTTVAPLTAQQYNVTRGPYNEVTQLDIDEFSSILSGTSRILTDYDDVEPYNVDWLKMVRGQSTLVLKPKTTEEVSKILAHCNNRRLAVVPQSGNTGLVGGSVPVFDEIVLSMSLMNNVISLDKVSGVLVCQAGCVLETLDSYLADNGLTMPLDLGAKGSCLIGGNASTNAGGLRLLRYGSLHGNILGIEAVLADGTVIDTLSTMRKDNTGYDLKQLFIGSEGTLGVVTALSILTPPRLSSVNVALVSCNDFIQAQNIYSVSKEHLGEILSAIEFFDYSCSELVLKHFGHTNPLGASPFYVLIETRGSNEQHDQEKLSVFLEDLMSRDIIANGTMATDETKIAFLWSLREKISEALVRDGATYKYDISLPVDRLYEIVTIMRERLSGLANNVVGYGHIGDGNIHLNIIGDTYSQELFDKIEPFVFEWTANHNGSISAEHGLGFKKANYIHYSKPPEAVQLMKQIKASLDPMGILNPYKTLPFR